MRDFIEKYIKIYRHFIQGLQLREVLHAVKAFDWRAYFLELRGKLQNLPRTNYELALYHLSRGNLYDARFRFWFAHYLDKSYVDSDYYIGLCYSEQFKYAKARPYLMRYLSQGNVLYAEEARFCLQLSENNGMEITKIPTSIIRYRSDRQVLQEGGASLYRAVLCWQRDVIALTNDYLQQYAKPFGNSILDLGCGTGGIGVLSRELKLASSIVGLDVSPMMVDIAKQQICDDLQVYNDVVNSTIELYVGQECSEHRVFDIVFASDALWYLRDITEVLNNISYLLADKGVIVIAGRISNEQDCIFNPYIRQFVLGAKDIENAAVKCKMHVAATKDISFPNGDHGAIYIIAR